MKMKTIKIDSQFTAKRLRVNNIWNGSLTFNFNEMQLGKERSGHGLLSV